MVKYSENIHSQNGEDGIIREVLQRLGYSHGKCCEFGSADGYFCSNTRALIDRGWTGLMYEASQGVYITPANVNEYVPKDIDVLSIDVDGNDYNIWEAYEGDPVLVVIEINSSISPDADRPVSDPKLGTGFKPMLELGERKGYFLLIHTGNMVFVKSKYKHLFPDRESSFNRSWLI